MSINQIQANGLNVSYYEAGTGPLVLCLHGFPDTAGTWDDLLPRLAAQGYRAVAPFLRGYPPTDAPADDDYSNLALGRDVAALIDALGAERAIVIGHDWGALAAYTAANLFPEKISKLITVAIPHPRTIRFNLGTAWKARHFITFQFRQSTVRWIKRNNFAAIDAIYRRWSPNWSPPSAETAPLKEALQKPGAVEAILGYYWSFAANRNNPEVRKATAKKTSVPTLCIVGAADGALSLEAMPHTPAAYTGPYKYHILPDVGHFLHREAPDAFAELVLNFLSTDPE